MTESGGAAWRSGPPGARASGVAGPAEDDRPDLRPAAALLVALPALAAGAGFAAPSLAVPLLSFGVAATVMGAALLLLRATAGGRVLRGARTRALEALFAEDPIPTALTDLKGRLLAANPALRARLHPLRLPDEALPEAPPGGAFANWSAGFSAPRLPDRIDALLEPARSEALAPSELYRLIRSARLEGRAEARGLRFDGTRRHVHASRVSADRILWRLEPEAAAGAAALAAALDALGLASITREGGMLRPNRAALALRPELAAQLAVAGDVPPDVLEARDDLPLRALRIPDQEARGAGPAWVLAPDLSQGRRGGDAAAASAEALERLPVAVARLKLDGTLIWANEPARRLLGPSAAAGARLEDLAEGLGRSIPERLAEAARGRATGRSEIARGRREDRETFLQLSLTLIDDDGEPALFAVLGDATELKTLEAQFVQSQKMQAVGQLAGGVAHDFNNLLTAIAGHCDLLLMRRDASDADHSDLMQIRQNTNRAAALVRQMLAFSRKQTLRPTVINLSDTLTELSHLLNRLLGEKVRLKLEHSADLGLVRVDERQFEQVVMNLVVNARDAMPGGGEVRVRTRNASFAEEFRRDRAVVPAGDYVAVEVSDSGHGIPPDRIGQIFEPFYTTKKQGEGTGLGLSTAYGIVKQTGGFIFADSPPGAGAIFTVYLPRHEGEAPVAPVKPASRPEAMAQAEGHVLLVEDEAPVRSFASRALRLRGFTVTEAENAEEALALLEDEAMNVDVIVSDVVMPGMDGPSWVKAARERRPDLSVVFVSGYAEGAFRRSLDGLEGFVFLPKPYSLNDLSTAIRAARSGEGAAA